MFQIHLDEVGILSLYQLLYGNFHSHWVSLSQCFKFTVLQIHSVSNSPCFKFTVFQIHSAPNSPCFKFTVFLTHCVPGCLRETFTESCTCSGKFSSLSLVLIFLASLLMLHDNDHDIHDMIIWIMLNNHLLESYSLGRKKDV